MSHELYYSVSHSTEHNSFFSTEVEKKEKEEALLLDCFFSSPLEEEKEKKEEEEDIYQPLVSPVTPVTAEDLINSVSSKDFYLCDIPDLEDFLQC